MRHLRLVAFQDQVSGECGLGFKGHTSHPELVADWTGALVAHDIVEHQNGLAKIGCWADECEAMGALWHVRGRDGMLDTRFRSPEHIVAGDILNIAVSVSNEDQVLYPRLDRYRTRPHDYDDEFEAILDYARPMIVREMEYESSFPIDAFLDNALHLMRTGYRKSRRRWGDRYLGIDTYEAIKSACAPHAKQVQADSIEGAEFRLSYGRGMARCEQVYEEAYW